MIKPLDISNCIALGYKAVCDEPQQLVLRVPLTEDPTVFATLKEKMTDEEFVVINKFFRRMIKNNYTQLHTLINPTIMGEQQAQEETSIKPDLNN